jgi:hypothetical protein
MQHKGTATTSNESEDEQRMGRQPHYIACHANDEHELQTGGNMSQNMQKLPYSAKTRSETCAGIKVSYEKCWQILKLRNIKCRKVICYS